MNVLWLSNSPCGSIRRRGEATIIGGWLISLEDELKKHKDINLNIVYLSRIKEPSFEYNGTRYYPLYNNHGTTKLQKLLYSRRSDKYTEIHLLPQLLHIIKVIQPDIIHIHGTEEFWGCIIPYVKNIPIVISIQGMIAPCKEKYFSGIPRKVAFVHDRLWDILIHEDIRTSWKSFVYRSKRERDYLTNIRYIFGRTFWDRLCTLTYNPQRKYYEVGEIMRPPFYQKHWQKSLYSDKLKIVTTISGGIYKGLETILKTASLLKYASFDFEWHIAGYRENTKWVYLSERVANVKSRDCNIIFHGRVTADELAELLSTSGIYVHASHIENSPNSVCEAMLIGVPIIATYAGGTASLLQHEKEGVLVQDGDPYVLAGAIIEMAQHPQKAELYAKAAQSRALIRHDPKRICEELLNGYNNIIQEFNS